MTGTPPPALVKVRVTRRVLDHLTGSGAGQAVRSRPNDPGIPNGEDEVSMGLMRKLFRDTKRRKDGSVTVTLTRDEVKRLDLYVDVMVMGAADNIGYDESALPEYNAGRALLRTLRATPTMAGPHEDTLTVRSA